MVYFTRLLLLGAAIAVSSCSIHTEIANGGADSLIDESKPLHLFVFLDGTANNPKSATNIWRLYRKVSNNPSPNTKSIYIEGVGANRRLSGVALGSGMQSRILKAYNFLATNYRDRRDKIYIFGFSRGAHQARALAGLISYSGLPTYTPAITEKQKRKVAKEIINASKTVSDSTFANSWKDWMPDDEPLLKQLNDEEYKTRAAEVEFVGVWDTVPGSSFKKYNRNYSEVSGCLSDRFNTARHECRCFTCKQHVQCLGS